MYNDVHASEFASVPAQSRMNDQSSVQESHTLGHDYKTLNSSSIPREIAPPPSWGPEPPPLNPQRMISYQPPPENADQTPQDHAASTSATVFEKTVISYAAVSNPADEQPVQGGSIAYAAVSNPADEQPVQGGSIAYAAVSNPADGPEEQPVQNGSASINYRAAAAVSDYKVAPEATSAHSDYHVVDENPSEAAQSASSETKVNHKAGDSREAQASSASQKTGKKDVLSKIKKVITGAMGKIKKAAVTTTQKIGYAVSTAFSPPVGQTVNKQFQQQMPQIADNAHSQAIQQMALQVEQEPLEEVDVNAPADNAHSQATQQMALQVEQEPLEEVDVNAPIVGNKTFYASLGEAVKKYGLSEGYEKNLNKLAQVIDEKKLLQAINSCDQGPSQELMLRTLDKVADRMEGDKFPDHDVYEKKDKDTYDGTLSFMMKPPGQLYIGMSKLEAGANNKVSTAYDITNGLQVIKRQAKNVPGNAKADVAEAEAHLQTSLYEKNKRDFLATSGMRVELKNKPGQYKYVSFSPRMDGDLNLLSHKFSTKEKLQILKDAVSGVSYMHQLGLIHLDIKPHNILVSQKNGKIVTKVNDFGTAKKPGEIYPGADPICLSPKLFDPIKKCGSAVPVDFSDDSYGIGVLIVESIVPNILRTAMQVDGPTGEVNNFLDQAKKDAFFTKLKEKHANDPALLKALDLAAELMQDKPENRPTAEQAASRLQKIYEETP